MDRRLRHLKAGEMLIGKRIISKRECKNLIGKAISSNDHYRYPLPPDDE